MTYRWVTEMEFARRVRGLDVGSAKCVTGPGRSGAIAAAYVSHEHGLPFIPYRARVPAKLEPVLVVDTAVWTGATTRKAARLYGPHAMIRALYHEPPMVKFWYEKAFDVRRREAKAEAFPLMYGMGVTSLLEAAKGYSIDFATIEARWVAGVPAV